MICSIFPSETAKYRHLAGRFCLGVGVDVASGGDPVVPWALNFDLPEPEFSRYRNNAPPLGTIQLRGFAEKLPFDSGSLDFVYSSHLLEDFEDWQPILVEWLRVLKPGQRASRRTARIATKDPPGNCQPRWRR